MSERGVDMARIGAVLQVLLQGGKPVFTADPATGELAPISPQLAAAALTGGVPSRGQEASSDARCVAMVGEMVGQCSDVAGLPFNVRHLCRSVWSG